MTRAAFALLEIIACFIVSFDLFFFVFESHCFQNIPQPLRMIEIVNITLCRKGYSGV
jgi:hypothetical protein